MSVGKPRATNKHLPRRMYWKCGAYWFVDPKNRWHRLDADYPSALKRYADFQDTAVSDHIYALIVKYSNEVLPGRAAETAKGRKKEF